jgi:hypothetical protein
MRSKLIQFSIKNYSPFAFRIDHLTVSFPVPKFLSIIPTPVEATVADLVTFVQSRPECRHISTSNIRLRCRGRGLPDSATIAELTDHHIDVEVGDAWPTSTVECSFYFPNGSVEKRAFPSSATLSYARDLIGRERGLSFDRFRFCKRLRTNPDDPPELLDAALLRIQLSCVPADQRTKIFVDSPFATNVAVHFPITQAAQTKLQDGKLTLPKVSHLDRVFDLKTMISKELSSRGGSVSLSAFRLTFDGTVLDDEMTLSTVGLMDNLSFNAEWVDPPVSRLYFLDLRDRRQVIDVVCQLSVTYRSLAHHFSDHPEEIAFEHNGQPLPGSETVGRRAIDPLKPIEITLRALTVLVENDAISEAIIDVEKFPTAGAVCSSLQERFRRDEILQLTYKGKPLEGRKKILDANPELEPMQLNATKRESRGRLSSLATPVKEFFGQQSSGADQGSVTIPDGAPLDAAPKSRTDSVAKRLTVRLQANVSDGPVLQFEQLGRKSN